MPVNWAALQNLSPYFISVLQKLKIEIVLVVLKVEPAPPIYPCPNPTPLKLDEALQAVKAGHFDASSFPLGYHLHWFHVKKNRLGLAIATLKSTLEGPDFLPITTIFHVQAPGEFYPVVRGRPGDIDYLRRTRRRITHKKQHELFLIYLSTRRGANFGARLTTLNTGQAGIRAGLHTICRDVAGADYELDFIASDNSVDRYDEVIQPGAWGDMANFKPTRLFPTAVVSASLKFSAKPNQ